MRRFIFLATLPIVFNSCYVLKQSFYFLESRKNATSIDKLMEKKENEEEYRLFKATVDIKKFATEVLKLNKDKNYTKYVYTEKDYLVSVVEACSAYDFKSYMFSFPIVGKVPYKGFYKREDALRLAKKLKEKGLDVMVRKVRAFSTLGTFADPLYSFMTNDSIYDLAETIIHEQTHATIWIKNEAKFNEELATFCGEKGAEEYMLSRYGENSQIMREYLDEKHDREVFISEMKKLATALKIVYSSNISREEKAVLKEKTISNFKQEMYNSYNSKFKTDNFRSITNYPINNAVLQSYLNYTGGLSLFYNLYTNLNNNLAKTIETVKLISKQKGEPKTNMLRFMETNI